MIRVIRNYGSHDPMHARLPGAVWISALDALPHPELDTIPDQVQLLRELQAAPELPQPEPELEPAVQMTPDISDVQYNLHVMDYWNWRIGRLVDGITGVRRVP